MSRYDALEKSNKVQFQLTPMKIIDLGLSIICYEILDKGGAFCQFDNLTSIEPTFIVEKDMLPCNDC